MHRRRFSRTLARFVLLWFALFVGVSAASPLIGAGGVQVICSSSGGMKVVPADQDAVDLAWTLGMDCPMCMTVTPPPPPATVRCLPPSPLAHVLRPIAAAHIASATAPPLPSRGPPARAA